MSQVCLAEDVSPLRSAASIADLDQVARDNELTAWELRDILLPAALAA